MAELDNGGEDGEGVEERGSRNQASGSRKPVNDADQKMGSDDDVSALLFGVWRSHLSYLCRCRDK